MSAGAAVETREGGTCLFGAIADDYTGGGDLAGMLFQGGVHTVQIFGLPPAQLLRHLNSQYQAAVLCLKSRSIAPADACRLSLQALDLLQLLNPRQVQFKYCSTFDSTSKGNIGPVTEALMDRLGVRFTVAVPALPVNQRTQYLGHLFVNLQLLSESAMRDHPVNPMTDSNLVRHLQAQTRRQVGLIALPVVQAGPASIRQEMERLQEGGVSIALVDAVCDADLKNIAEAVADLPLITGGSGLSMALPAIWRRRGWLREPRVSEVRRASAPRPAVVLSGSCSAATLQQLDSLRKTGCAMIPLDVAGLLSNNRDSELDRLLSLSVDALRRSGRVAVYSSATVEERARFRDEAVAKELDPALAAPSIEAAFGELALRLVRDAGVRSLIVAGGETAGAVVSSLQIQAAEITGVLDPGVPSVRSLGAPLLSLALKPGNFGSPDFFDKAIRHLEQT